MTNLKALLKELAPKGVPHTSIETVCDFNRGKWIKANLLVTGPYPVVTSGQKVNEFHNVFNRSGESITIASSGAYAGFVNYWNQDIYLSNAFTADPKNPNLLLPKFLYFFLKNKQNFIHGLASGGGVPNVYGHDLHGLQIPIPPLEIQIEIVRILDTFTKLEEELEEELEARKVQYQFYHKNLVGFGKSDEEVNWSTVQDICDDKFWLMPATPKFEINGDIPYITSRNLSDGVIDFSSIKMISHESYKQISKNRTISPGDILIGMIGTIGEVGHVQPQNLPFYGQNMYLLRLNPRVVDTNYFLQFMNSAEVRHHFASVKHNSSQGYLKAEHIDNLRIPLPPLAEQKSIAKVLDTFKELTTNLTYGLPAEISARRQQYEYYRSKLMNFKEMEVA